MAKLNNLNYLVIYPKWHNNWSKYCYNKGQYLYEDDIKQSLYNIIESFRGKYNKQIIIGENI